LEAVSLYELNEYIQRVLALNFQESIWVKCEIAQVQEVRGQVYLELIQKEEKKDDVIAKSSAIIWYKSYLFIQRKLKDLSDSILQEGVDVLIKVKVEFHERYGLKLSIEDIDPSYTIGQAAIQRQKIIDQLKKEKLIKKNSIIPMPIVLQNIAIISSERAAGYHDFLEQVENNPYQFAHNLWLYQSAMQGANVEYDILSALDEIEQDDIEYDCVVIIRGGGAKLDLSAFDNYKLSKRVANYSLPVITGIGHEIDQTILDMVAHTELKTPTAVANYIIDRNLFFESSINNLGNRIKSLSVQKLQTHRNALNDIKNWLRYLPAATIQKEERAILLLREQMVNATKSKIQKEERSIQHLKEQMLNATKSKIEKQKWVLQSLQEKIDLLNPQAIMKRGFSFATQNGKVLLNADEAVEGQEMETHLLNGVIKSKVIKS
jgi:exodeoxyribonuclease VII large subunit